MSLWILPLVFLVCVCRKKELFDIFDFNNNDDLFFKLTVWKKKECVHPEFALLLHYDSPPILAVES